ncbi:MAG: hypothetical protein JHC95_17620 [Solirubrobacteraceae bacterium]|nr:hypothetical protein [Solirubrobacteraceae bacterium]
MTRRLLRRGALVGAAALTVVALPIAAAHADEPPPTCFGYTAQPPLGFGGVTVTGTNGPDVLVGTFGNDIIDGKNGNDLICGLGGDDVIIGGPHVDRIAGNAGNDDIAGWAGNDILVGGPGDDTLKGNQDDDDMRSGEGQDILIGGPGADSLHGGSGDDRLNGYDGDDVCIGWVGTDQQINCETFHADIERSPFLTPPPSENVLLSLASSTEAELTTSQEQTTLAAAFQNALPAYNEGDPVPADGVNPSTLAGGAGGYVTTGALAVETGDAAPGDE